MRFWMMLVVVAFIWACGEVTEPESRLPANLRIMQDCSLHDIQSGPGYMDAVWVCDTRQEAEAQAEACENSGAASTSQLPYNSVECNWVIER